ncbi:MAG: tRNA (adenosine(37)-N6)-threonylcarbamoyltransferase complex transferase subunit TsaD [Hyphomicrobiales bacterium]|jgi:N6-L-threonylcarbamoyladenine synthase|nr:tRNA (adenosine(37)-N6)-threonylcarbamoyltransferase complex transferase subunit TsaD [Hyphomicrobiales bacterium]|tara:strand:+ start:916 stop:1983 length:1068 start_codon:yes stop_codon:yes gene_type:complete
MIILGIETSCDETSASIVKEGSNGQCEILANIVHSQILEHTDYGGVVPEIAARSHIQNIDTVIEKSISESKIKLRDLDAIAVTSGPGLKGGLLVGVTFAQAMASVLKIPLLGINHLEGHALTIRMVKKIQFPYLLLLVTGGHTQLIIVKDVGDYEILGTTIDDALGEAYDKVSKSLNLGYPGGPIVERMAEKYSPSDIKFPRPLINSKDLNFSFSGLKTAVRREIENSKPIDNQKAYNICAEFQDSVIDVILSKLSLALNIFKNKYKISNVNIVIAGGVAANKKIFSSIEKISKDQKFNVFVAPQDLCTDNAAMIAWCGIERLRMKNIEISPVIVKPRWPLDKRAVTLRGAGVKA